MSRDSNVYEDFDREHFSRDEQVLRRAHAPSNEISRDSSEETVSGVCLTYLQTFAIGGVLAATLILASAVLVVFFCKVTKLCTSAFLNCTLKKKILSSFFYKSNIYSTNQYLILISVF